MTHSYDADTPNITAEMLLYEYLPLNAPIPFVVFVIDRSSALEEYSTLERKKELTEAAINIVMSDKSVSEQHREDILAEAINFCDNKLVPQAFSINQVHTANMILRVLCEMRSQPREQRSLKKCNSADVVRPDLSPADSLFIDAEIIDDPKAKDSISSRTRSKRHKKN